MDPAELLFVEDDLHGPEIGQLLELHAREMLANSPEKSTHFLDVDGLRAPDVTFWSTWVADELVGCGALRELDPSHGEVKSMRTAPSHREQGVGRAVLAHIVSVARARDYTRISLETGSAPIFDAAVRLYLAFGFERTEPFGAYRDDPHSRFFTLNL